MTPKGTMFKNFGPMIGCYKLEKEHLSKLQEYSNNILDTPELNVNWGKNLAGQIHNEPYLIENEEIYNILNIYTRHYTRSYLSDFAYDLQKTKINTRIDNAWLVDQRPGEYNPIHHPIGTNLSSVLYLEMPELEYDIELLDKGKQAVDGQIAFVNNSNRVLDEFEMGEISWTPNVGSVYVFPSRLLHAVNPWKGKGRRLSLSWNTEVTLDPKRGVRLKPLQKLASQLTEAEKQLLKDQIAPLAKTKMGASIEANRESS